MQAPQAPSQFELELRCWLLEIDRNIERQRCDEYRRMMVAMATGGHPGPILPAPVLVLEQEPMPVPVGGPPSSVVQAAAFPIPHVPVAGPATWERRSVLSSSLTASSSSSRLSDDFAGRGRSRGRSRSRSRGRGRGRGARAVASLTPIGIEPSRNAFNDDDESRTARTNTPVSQVSVGGRLEQPSRLRRVFLDSLGNSIPAGPRFDPFSVDSHSSPPRTGDSRFGSRDAVDLLLRANGVEPSSQLRPPDAALADATPDVHPAHFTALFGGNPQNERPLSRVRNILCLNPVLQPYAPSSPGEPGVLLIAPGIVQSEDEHPSFHVFIDMSPPQTRYWERHFRYVGEYAKVACATVEVVDWQSLPIWCRTTWSWRIFSSTTRKVRALHARVALRNARPHSPAPTQDEIEAWLDSHPGRREGLTEAILFNAFNIGEEKMNFALLKCVGYNVGVAMKLQGMDGPG